MRFNWRMLIHVKSCRVVLILISLFFVAEYFLSIKIKRENPYIKGVKQIRDSSDNTGNNSFVYYHAKHVKYPRIKDDYFGISTEAAILSPHYKECVKNDDYMDFSFNVFNDQLPRSWHYLKSKTIKNTKQKGVKTDDFYIAKELFRFQGSNRDYRPSEKDIAAFKKSDACKDGFVYIGDGWFYKADYDVMRALKTYSTTSTRYSYSSHVYIGNPLITILIEIITYFFNNYRKSQDSMRNSPYQQLFENCKEGDMRVKFRVFDSKELSMIAYRYNNTLKLGNLNDEKYGRIVHGLETPREIMRPVDYLGDRLLVLRFIVMILTALLINWISVGSKEHSMNVILFSCIVYVIRSFIWNIGVLKPAISVSLLIVFLTLYVAM